VRDRQGELLGLPRLSALFAATPMSPAAIIQDIQTALATFSQASSPHDDTTLLCAQVL
jgi:serine phosphatase RsbU (regulator of sigma subunit)